MEKDKDKADAPMKERTVADYWIGRRPLSQAIRDSGPVVQSTSVLAAEAGRRC